MQSEWGGRDIPPPEAHGRACPTRMSRALGKDREWLSPQQPASEGKALNTGDTLDLSRIGMVFRVMKTGAETAGRSFEMEMDLLPRSGGTPLHLNPSAMESYEVLHGTF